MHDTHPRDYLIDVLQRVDQHPTAKIDELTTSQWKEPYGSNYFYSDLDC